MAEDTEKMERVDIAPDGDLILEVGKLELRVHSLVMSISSPVFKVMLGPKYAEGQTPGTASCPKRIPLPEDQPDAMKLLCLVFYGRGDLLQETPDACDMLQLANAADKYGCMDQVRLTLEAWLYRFGNFTPGRSTGALRARIQTAFVLDHARYFADFTRHLVGSSEDDSRPQPKKKKGSPRCCKFGKEECELSGDELTERILSAVEANAKTLRSKLAGGISEAVDRLCRPMMDDHYRGNTPNQEPHDRDANEYDPDYNYFAYTWDGKIPPKCDYTQQYVWLHLNGLSKGSLWPPSTQPSNLNRLRETVTRFCDSDSICKPDRSIRPCHQKKIDNSPCNLSFNDADELFRGYIEKLGVVAKDMDFAMCLDCFKAGGKFDGECRVRHKK